MTAKVIGHVTYLDHYAELVAKNLACGPWQEGLADGRYAWDESNVTDDPIVKEAWRRIDERCRGESYVRSAKLPHIYARQQWKHNFEWRCSQNHVSVKVSGPNAILASKGALFAKGAEIYLPMAKASGLDKLPVEFHRLAHVATVGQIPVFEADVVPLKWAGGMMKPERVYIVGRVDIPHKIRPTERLLKTLKKATNLATRLEMEREDFDMKLIAEEAANGVKSEWRKEQEAIARAAAEDEEVLLASF